MSGEVEAFTDQIFPVRVIENDCDKQQCRCVLLPFDEKDETSYDWWNWTQLHEVRQSCDNARKRWEKGDHVHVNVTQDMLMGMSQQEWAVWQKARVCKRFRNGRIWR